MSQNGLNFQHISSKEGLTKKDIHSIWPWLSPILWRFEELLLGCVALQSCRIGGRRFTTVKELVSLGLCQLTGGLWSVPFAM